ncbi:MAG: MFS transporter [Desulfarculaceae bacterium]|nr:MFS transporter [Desulfarculaceae bacterium]MCF8046697.1 MFS transporter [Desulfarculaceae bacterium]MCF8064080.1 MFS transporter [Desulfarculaceae bacterium]MCF8098232.1 MFS transporter [Desulfarculaceae bacterium]MCF8121548.1 MFS transporter [Desulfarculaceae bacterium]
MKNDVDLHDSTVALPAGVYYGWYVVGVAFLANFAAAGSQFYAFNAFMLPLCELRGWTRADINLAPIIGFICGLLGQYSYGSIISITGPRRLMAMGALVSAAAFVTLGQAQELWLFYLAYILLIMGNAAMASLVANTAVSNWFVRLRGRAMGMATSGLTMAGVILPFAAYHLLHTVGLGWAFAIIGLGIACLAPIAWLVVRDSPESCGMLPDGQAVAPQDRASIKIMPQSQVPPSQLIKSPSFWKVGMAYGLASAGVFAVVFQLGPRFQDLGMDGDTAMIMVALTSVAGTCGKFTWGTLCDRFPPNRLAAVMFSMVGLGQILGLVASGPITVGFFILVFGFGMGGIMSTFPIISAWCFGRAAFASVFRLLALFLGLQAVGYVLMGGSFSLTGSYDAAYLVFIFVDMAAAAVIVTVKPSVWAQPSASN